MMKLRPDEYGSYYEGYIRYTDGKELIPLYLENESKIVSLIGSLDEEKSLYRYEDGKWSVKEVIGHIIDTERIFNYRALSLARGEAKALQGYDHNLYVKTANFDRFPLDLLRDQYVKTRRSTIALFQTFSEEERSARGIVNESEFTVRGLGYVIAGHELHHLAILEERYLGDRRSQNVE